MMARRKREMLKPSFVLNVFTAFKVSLLRIKMHFPKNRKGYLFYKCSFQNSQLCYHSAKPVIYYMLILEFLLLFDCTCYKTNYARTLLGGAALHKFMKTNISWWPIQTLPYPVQVLTAAFNLFLTFYSLALNLKRVFSSLLFVDLLVCLFVCSAVRPSQNL